MIATGQSDDLLHDRCQDGGTDDPERPLLVGPHRGDGALVEACLPKQVFPARARESALEYRRTFRDPVMTRYDAIRVIAAALDSEAVVANIGVPSKEVYAANDRDTNFYMLGSYTQATPIGLGLALETDRDIVVLDGDGSLLGTAVLPVVAAEAPENLTIVCLDNGAFGSTGNQPTPASGLVDMEFLARAAGIRRTCKVQDEEAWESRERGPTFIHVVLKPGNAPVGNIPLAPGEIRERFVRAIMG
jgi:sulfopyruvate decarboxylase subunit beta